MGLNFEKYAHEGNSFIKELSMNLGHPGETARAGIILRAVMHTLRERISIGESLNLVSQLPMFLKGIYVDNWEFNDRQSRIKTIEDFKDEVKRLQEQYGEQQFDWELPTDEIIRVVFSTLNRYVSEGESEDIIAQMPKELKELFSEKAHR
ncbi:MAG TPA: DUF2267 domain-containing protein [Bacteroidales bacterium]|nr:DUF2267 domain-containing protein [Bacteroidales bacterium]